MLFDRKHMNPAILIFHELNRAHHNAIMNLMAQRNLQDVSNPLILYILFRAMESGEISMISSQKKLAEIMHVSPATIANSLKSLERSGYVRKEPDPKDARRNQVYITEKGRHAVTECLQIFNIVDEQLLKGFSEEELTQLRSFHQRMLDNLAQIGSDRDPLHDPCLHHEHDPFSNRKE